MAEYYFPDLAFLVNFLMDYLLLWLVKICRNRSAGKGRIAVSAAFGALCSCLSVFIRLSSIPAVLYLFGIAALMCLIAFGKRRNAFLKNYFTLLFLTFVMGGMIYSLSMVFQGRWGRQEKEILFPSSGLVLLTAFAVLIFFLARYMRREEKKRLIYPVKLFLFGQEISCFGLMDTGNCLYDPFYGKPVVLLTDEMIYHTMRKGLSEEPGRIRFVPFSSVGKKQGILEGTELTELVIQLEDEEIRRKNVIAVYAGFDSQGKEYQVILHPDLVQD